MVATMAGKEGDAPPGHLTHCHPVGRGSVGCLDCHVGRAVEKAVETRTSEQAKLRPDLPCHRRCQADFSAVFLLPSEEGLEEEPEEEPEEELGDFWAADFSPVLSAVLSLFSPGLALPPPEPARRLSVE